MSPSVCESQGLISATQSTTRPADASGTFALGGDLPVNRLGYGAMQLTGPGVWREPRDPDAAVRVLRRAVELGVTFIPWSPIAAGELARPGGPLDAASRLHDASPAQLALAWLLRRSPVVLPIPGTSSAAHLEENVNAAPVRLEDQEFEALTAA
ncbi:aldo/keto reductase [Streptomyces sp. NPDC059752]|uniref:aldo/keto reductase n=1 Tax=unclassified Streptomyces TaxID=2593676 RepID=UPI0036532921